MNIFNQSNWWKLGLLNLPFLTGVSLATLEMTWWALVVFAPAFIATILAFRNLEAIVEAFGSKVTVPKLKGKDRPKGVILSHDPAMVFGIQEIKPLRGFPEGRARVRMSVCDSTMVYIKTASGIREFYVREKEGFWIPDGERRRNERVSNTKS